MQKEINHNFMNGRNHWLTDFSVSLRKKRHFLRNSGYASTWRIDRRIYMNYDPRLRIDRVIRTSIDWGFFRQKRNSNQILKAPLDVVAILAQVWKYWTCGKITLVSLISFLCFYWLWFIKNFFQRSSLATHQSIDS